jgi:hypothetical protein
MAKPAVMKKYDSDFEILIPGNLELERNTPKSKEVAQKIKSFYFGDQPVSQETLLQYVEVSKYEVHYSNRTTSTSFMEI